MIITTTSTKIIPNAIYTKNAGKIFSNKPIVNARIAIIDIPIPIEPNRCAMACQGCGAVFLFLNKKAVETKSYK